MPLNLMPWILALLSTGMPFEAELALPNAVGNERVTQLAALDPGITYTIMDVEGPGCITHLWMTIGTNNYRGVMLRMYWDDETEPSVEAPVTDFFGVGHNRAAPEQYFATPVLSVAPTNGYNAYFPMPFRKRARIAVTNDQAMELKDGGGIYFQADYVTYDSLPADTPYFHAQWRREAPATRRGRPHTIVAATGSGFLAGVTHHVRRDDRSDEWFHGGGDYIFVDGETRPNVIKGIGGEDFFGESWHSANFVSAYSGSTSHRDGEISMYRFFLEGPIRFRESVRFAYGALENEITSVGYWYQTEPHARFFRMPRIEQRMPRSKMEPGGFDIELDADAQVTVAVLGPMLGDIDLRSALDGATAVDTSAALQTNYPLPYKRVGPEAPARPVRWERARTILSWLDFDAFYKPKVSSVTGVQSLPLTVSYVLVRMRADGARAPTLILGHDDPVRAWLNGAPVADLEAGPRFTRAEVPLSLKSGDNMLLLKVANAWNVNFAANALALSFASTEGVEFDDFATLPETPELGR